MQMFESNAKPFKYYKRKKLRKQLKGLASGDPERVAFMVRIKDPDVPFGDHFRVDKVVVEKGFEYDSLIISSKELNLVYETLLYDNRKQRSQLKLNSILIKDLKRELKLNAKNSDKRTRVSKRKKS